MILNCGYEWNLKPHMVRKQSIKNGLILQNVCNFIHHKKDILLRLQGTMKM